MERISHFWDGFRSGCTRQRIAPSGCAMAVLLFQYSDHWIMTLVSITAGLIFIGAWAGPPQKRKKPRTHRRDDMDAINIIKALGDPIKAMKDIGKRYQEGGKSRDIAKAEGIAFLVDMKACGAPPQARAGAAGAMFGMTDAMRIWRDELKWPLER